MHVRNSFEQEVINGQEYNEMSDMWSLGCLIYELCALHPPFQATTHKQLAAKIRDGRFVLMFLYICEEHIFMLSIL